MNPSILTPFIGMLLIAANIEVSSAAVKASVSKTLNGRSNLTCI